MKVSIITPSYNNAQYIRGTIDSVLYQTWGAVEHIVVDGGSTDGTIDILQSYPHVRWISEPDRGMYDAINKGIRMATGEIIAYLNADDRYLPHTVATVVRAFQSDQTLDFVYGYCEYIDALGRSLFVIRPLSFCWARHSLRLLWPQPTWFWRKRLHQMLGFFDESLRTAGDADFMRRMVLSGSHGRLLPNILAQFMLRDDSLLLTLDADRSERRKVIEYYRAHLWSLRSVIAEILFAVKNLDTLYMRKKFRNASRHLERTKRA